MKYILQREKSNAGRSRVTGSIHDVETYLLLAGTSSCAMYICHSQRKRSLMTLCRDIYCEVFNWTAIFCQVFNNADAIHLHVCLKDLLCQRKYEFIHNKRIPSKRCIQSKCFNARLTTKAKLNAKHINHTKLSKIYMLFLSALA